MWKQRLIFGLCLGGSALLWVMRGTYGAFSLLTACVFLPLLSLLLTALAAGRLQLQIETDGTVGADEQVKLRIRTINRAVIPAARIELSVRICNALSLSETVSRLILSPPGHTAASAELVVRPAYAGTLTVQAIEATFCDCFCLFHFRRAVDLQRTVTVWPKVELLPLDFEEFFGRAYDSERYSETRSGSDVSEVFDMHVYKPGDEVRKINWKLSSKHDELIVRDFSYPLNSMMTIMLELTQTEERRLDRSIELFLSFSRSLISSGVVHNIAWYDGGGDVFHLTEIASLEAFDAAAAALIASGGYTEPSIALMYYLENVYDRNGTLFYIAAEPDPRLTEEASVEQNIVTLDPDRRLEEITP